jgi:hypothetical protein
VANATSTRLKERLQPLLRDGSPLALIAVLAIGCVVALLISANSRTNSKPLAFAELGLNPASCAVVPDHSFNVGYCRFLRRGVYEISFATPLRHTAALVSRASCCGSIGAVVSGERTVIVTIPPPRRLVQATILLP